MCPGRAYHESVQLAFTTVDELVALLEQAGEPLDYREVWPRLFRVAKCPPELMRTLVSDIVRDDERLVWDGPFHVSLDAWRAQRRDLSTVAFTVVDLETTGGTPGFTKITEIGAVRVENGRQVATFSQLVDPRQPVPAKITEITGINAAMLVGQPPIEEVLPRFLEFSADSVLVAHNARFDLGFLDYELSVLMSRTFPRPTLDTLRLARRLLSPMRCSLAALAERFDTAVKPSHRALDDALATAEILLLLLARLQEQGVTTLEEVVRLCEPGARRNYHKIVLTEGLPTRPGVYIMRDAHGHELYIGKAENLRRRSRDHFLQRQAYGARQALELLDRIDVLETGSEFAALLLESRLIGKHRPPYNQHGTRVSSYHYVKLTTDQFPRIYATPNRRDDDALYAGPFRRAGFARRLVDLLNAVYPLRTCAHLRDSSGEQRACLPAPRHRRLPGPLSRHAERRVRARPSLRSAGCCTATAGSSTASSSVVRPSSSASWPSSRPPACRRGASRSSRPCARSASCAAPAGHTPCSSTRPGRPAGSLCTASPRAASSTSGRCGRATSHRRPPSSS